MKTIKISEINKIEGHISFQAALEKGNVKEAKITVEEGARLIEGILIGRNYYEAPIITARVCGICPVAHNLTSIKALEQALGIKISEPISRLRKIILAAQIAQSHSLHLYFCSLPDFFELSDNFQLFKKFHGEGKKIMAIRNFVNKVVEVIGGRTIHPINSVVGGFNVAPKEKDLIELRKEIKDMIKIAVELAEFFEKLKYPKFERTTEYICLSNSAEYGFYSGDLSFFSHQSLLASLFKGKVDTSRFFEYIKEIENGGVEKRTEHKEHSYMTGAIARIHNNHKKLSYKARIIFDRNKKNLLSFNSFYNIMAQAVEVVHFLQVMEKELDSVLKNNNQPLHSKIDIKEGKGLAVCEAPRGMLLHQYTIDNKGKITNCNIITPTAQFLNNLEDDMKEYLKDAHNTTAEKIKFLIRAYDPCISCAAH